MKVLSNEVVENRPERPIKIVQFGEGNFLRAFVDWMLQELNNAGIYNGDVAVVQPLDFGRIKELEEQDGLYTLVQEGVKDGEFIASTQVIDILSKFVNPYADYEAYLKLAEIDTLEFIFSNTTESGIVLDESDTIENTPPQSFPGKLLAFLHHRYEKFAGAMDKGLFIVPCELIDDNGDELYNCVKRLAEIHQLDAGFMKWLDEANTFTNTLVDRIVPGYPAARIDELTKKLGYVDNNIVMGEIFHLWVIEDRNGIGKILDGAKAGLNMVFTDDIKPYKIQKVRILNGLHTLMVPVAYLKGIDTVGDAMKDELMLTFIKNTNDLEIIPGTEHYLSKETLTAYANEIYDRFGNPQVHHELMAISLNSTAKFKSRLLPTALDYVKVTGRFPAHMAFSLASLLVFFKGERHGEKIDLQDEPQFLEFYADVWAKYEADELDARGVVAQFLGLTSHWEQNLNEIAGLTNQVTETVEAILADGMEVALANFLA
ncbi:MAG: tagaturonate reductase [Turicibacter sp.]|nr:tagaturonate reductase [Turicibacter sp.]